MANFAMPPSLPVVGQTPVDPKLLAQQISTMNRVLQTNFTQLSKRLIKPKNLANECMGLRQIAGEVYATVVQPDQMGKKAVVGVSPTLARGDHTHLVQPVLYLQRSDNGAFGGNQNDFALADTIHTQQFISASAAVNLTGIAGGVNGYTLILTNNGSTNVISLTNEDAGSQAVNRFHFTIGATIQLFPGQSIIIAYDATLQRWRDAPSPQSQWLFRSAAALPTATDIPAGTVCVWKDTAGGSIKLTANDGGVLKSVALV